MTGENVSRWWHYKHIKAWRYVVASLGALVFCAWLSLHHHDWTYIERSGGIIALFGALLGLRKLLRKGTRSINKPNEPLFKAGKFGIGALLQHVEETSDAFAQELGLALVVLGTFISSFGALLLKALVPLAV